MTIGSGIAIASVWAAVTLVTYTMRKDASPFGIFIFMLAGVWATYYAAGLK